MDRCRLVAPDDVVLVVTRNFKLRARFETPQIRISTTRRWVHDVVLGEDIEHLAY